MSAPRKLVIKHHSPLHIFAVIVASCTVIAVTVWVYLDESQWSYIMSSLSEAKKSKGLWQENQTMKSTIVKLEERIVMLERTAQVERQTITNLQQSMVKQQDEIYKLRNELDFYQGIMTSAGESKGLNIQGLHIEETSQPRSYYFKLILTHVSKSDKVAAGKLSILLEGVQRGTARTIDIRELTLSESLSLNFKFGNFERIEGSIMLPENFIVHRVIVRARQDGKRKTPEIERVFDWPQAMSH
ncbi:MAG: hypothetical protein KAJ03_05490 [Gammaproteobacteria bacterium]|nr:hypothetical protein [Gammaproteobacteria bacterium]